MPTTSALEKLGQCLQTSDQDITDSFDTLAQFAKYILVWIHWPAISALEKLGQCVQTTTKDISDSFDTLVQFVKYIFTTSLDTFAFDQRFGQIGPMCPN